VTVNAYIGSTRCGSGAVKSGVYGINVVAVQDQPGCGTPGATVTFKVGDYWMNETGTWTTGIPQSINLTGPKMTTLNLAQGCGNQVVITYANKTPVKTFRDAVSPAANLTGIWRWNAKNKVWDGDFPSAPESVNTLKTLDRLDTIWVCTSGPATLTQPAVDFQ
jgi:hypothetical protein